MLPTNVQIDNVILKKTICGLFADEMNVLSDVIHADC